MVTTAQTNLERMEARPLNAGRQATIIAVGGGKGGIGKTLVSTSFAIELARRGKQVILVDADLGGANVHTCLGVDPPLVTLSDFTARRVSRITDVAIETGIPRLRLVAGALDALDAANPRFQQKQKVIRHIQQMNVDYVVLDLGAGTHYNVLDFFLVADRGVVVLVPEPTSIENVYRFIKAAFFRRLSFLAEEMPIKALVENAMGQKGAARTPFQVLSEAQRIAPEHAPRLQEVMRGFRPALVVNQVRSREDGDVGHAVVAAWRKYFGLDMDLLGGLSYDDEVWQSVRRRKPLLIDRPSAAIAAHFARAVDQLLILERLPRGDG